MQTAKAYQDLGSYWSSWLLDVFMYTCKFESNALLCFMQCTGTQGGPGRNVPTKAAQIHSNPLRYKAAVFTVMHNTTTFTRCSTDFFSGFPIGRRLRTASVSLGPHHVRMSSLVQFGFHESPQKKIKKEDEATKKQRQEIHVITVNTMRPHTTFIQMGIWWILPSTAGPPKHFGVEAFESLL